MKDQPHYIKVTLDKNAKIVEFECTLRDVQTDFTDVVGKNWFDTFIENIDKEKVKKVFADIFDSTTKKWETYGNDIKCVDGHHKLIDFDNELVTIDGEKFISSYGVEHIDNI